MVYSVLYCGRKYTLQKNQSETSKLISTNSHEKKKQYVTGNCGCANKSNRAF